MRISTIAMTTAGALAAGAIATRVQTREIARTHPARGRIVSTSSGRLHVLDAGEGPPLLLIHGNAVTSEDWVASGLFDTLAQTHRVIAPDRPGYGHSERARGRAWTPRKQAAAIAELLGVLRVEPVVVVAHSLGAQIALRLALDNPGRVAGLVLISGYYTPTPRLDSVVAGLSAAPLVGDLMRHTVSGPAGRLTAPMIAAAIFAPKPVPDGYVKAVIEPSLAPLQMRACSADGFYMLGEASRLQKRLGELTAPMAVIAGEDDKVISPKVQSAAFAQATGARLAMAPGVGHMVHHVEGPLVLDAIADVTRAGSSPQSTRDAHNARADSPYPDEREGV